MRNVERKRSNHSESKIEYASREFRNFLMKNIFSLFAKKLYNTFAARIFLGIREVEDSATAQSQLERATKGVFMNETTVHMLDKHMFDLRQILSQGRKRIGLLIGAGAPASVCVNDEGEICGDGEALIPDGEKITALVVEELKKNNSETIEAILSELGGNPNIEEVLTRIRQLSQVVGNTEFYGLKEEGYKELTEQICSQIGKIVSAELPKEPNPFTKLVSWISGIHREHPIEIFTTNYDLLFEEAFERVRLSYFDGFSGSHKPFFDPASVSDNLLPAYWPRVWKIHGSLGWETQWDTELKQDTIVRTGSRTAANLIYPDHMKYDQITRQPYSAFFDRLREFLKTSDSLLLCSGFSFSDSHIASVLNEALGANASAAVFAFQYKSLDEEPSAVQLALRRSNMSVYAPDGAVISGTRGKWRLGDLPAREWNHIRRTFWSFEDDRKGREFLLGDFAALTHFFALARSLDLKTVFHQNDPDSVKDVVGEDNAQS